MPKIILNQFCDCDPTSPRVTTSMQLSGKLPRNGPVTSSQMPSGCQLLPRRCKATINLLSNHSQNEANFQEFYVQKVCLCGKDVCFVQCAYASGILQLPCVHFVFKQLKGERALLQDLNGWTFQRVRVIIVDTKGGTRFTQVSSNFCVTIN